MLTFTAPMLEGYTCRGKVTTKGSTYRVMVMAMDSSYIEENGGHVRPYLQRNLEWLTGGLYSNGLRNDDKPCGHELAAHPLHNRDKKIRENTNFRVLGKLYIEP